MPDSAVSGAETIEGLSETGDGLTARALLRRLIMLYVWGSAAAVLITFFLVLVGLEFTPEQWLGLFLITPFAVLFYVLSDIYVIVRHFRPIKKVYESLEQGIRPPEEDVSPAIARALNLPFYSFIRVTFMHGPGAALSVLVGLTVAEYVIAVDYETWQIAGFVLAVLFFAAPTHAIFEYFGIARVMGPVYERLWRLCPSLRDQDHAALISINLKQKLLYLAVFVTALPLFFFAISILFKAGLLLDELEIEDPLARLGPLLQWVGGVVAVCMLGALTMSVLTASEVSRSATRMLETMREVQQGRLDRRLSIIMTDEYMDLYRGFNQMTESLREEVRILEVTQDLSGELNLDRLIARIMTAATELLGAERSTLFVYDRKTDELWSRFAEGLDESEIRIPTDQGIAGAVFTKGGSMNIEDAYSHPLFNASVDRRTGFRTRSILCMSIVNKAGERIGVTQVLNKRGGPFTAKDEARLRAFTAQIGVTLENAQLFDDVLNMKNYNEGILRSTTNGIVTLDVDNCVVRANDSAVKLLRTSLDAIVGRPIEEIVGSGNQWIVRSVENVRRTGENDLSVDTVIDFGAGDSSNCNITVAPLKDINDESMGSMVIIEDISNEKRVRATMARYMSKEVADQLLAAGESELGGKNQVVTILFSDIRSFTTISEAMGARETVSMLNEYFEDMVDVVLSHGGILDKYIGDSIMALFGAPFAGEHDADHAANVANGMLVALRGFNARRAADGKPTIDIGVGMATGDVVVGNIGSTKRMEYTVIGDGVNLASRLEGANKFYGTKILLAETTVQQMTDPKPPMREIDLIRVKGKDRPVTVYEGLGYHTDETFPRMEETLAAFREGFGKYRARDWKGAQGCFEAALAAHPGDTPSRIYLERCMHYHDAPPEDDWDGVWVMTSK